MSVVAIGCRASVMVEGSDDEEWRKRLPPSCARSVRRPIDNLRRPLDSGARCAHRAVFKDRILGVSETTSAADPLHLDRDRQQCRVLGRDGAPARASG